MRISPWWLLVGAIAAGAALTGIASALGSEHLTVLDWLATTATVAALVITVGIYRLQEKSSSEAHVEMMQQLEAQGELLNEFAKTNESSGESTPDAPVQPPAEDALTSEQRASVEDRFGEDSIEGTFDPGRGRGKRSRARLVRLRDGRLVAVYEDPRRGRITVREIDAPRRGRRPPAAGDR